MLKLNFSFVLGMCFVLAGCASEATSEADTAKKNDSASVQSNVADVVKTEDVAVKVESPQAVFLAKYKGKNFVYLRPIEGEGTTPYCALTASDGSTLPDLEGYDYMGVISGVEAEFVVFSKVINCAGDAYAEVSGYDNSRIELSSVGFSLRKCSKTDFLLYDEPDTTSVKVSFKRDGFCQLLDECNGWMKISYLLNRTEYIGWIKSEDVDPFPYGFECK